MVGRATLPDSDHPPPATYHPPSHELQDHRRPARPADRRRRIPAVRISPRRPAAAPAPTVHTVLDVTPSDVSAVKVDGADGKTVLAMEKQGDAWHLTQPVRAAADVQGVHPGRRPDDQPEVDQRRRRRAERAQDRRRAPAVHGRADWPPASRSTLAIGDRLAVGDGVYALVIGHDTVDVIPPACSTPWAARPTSSRKTQLFDGVTSADVKQLAITAKDGSVLKLAKAKRHLAGGSRPSRCRPIRRPSTTCSRRC